MFRTPSSRYLLSHILPHLLLAPLLGLSLMSVVETQVVRPMATQGLLVQSGLVAEAARDQQSLFADPAQAQAFVARLSLLLEAQLTLLDPAGRLLASSNVADAGQQGLVTAQPGLPEALAGKTQIGIAPGQPLAAPVVVVMEPVQDAHGQVIGVVRVSLGQADSWAPYLRMRWWILGLIAAAIALGSGLGLALGEDLERSLRALNWAMSEWAAGRALEPLAETGPTEVRRLARATTQQERSRRQLEESRQRLLDNLVHELGRPLGALHSAVQALQGGAHAEAALRDELLAGMDGQIRRLNRLVDDLAGLGHQGRRGQQLARQPIEANAWLQPVLAVWRQMAAAKGLHWQCSVPAELPIVDVDVDRVSQALGNLLSNAVKYTPSGGVVSVEAGASGAFLWIRVSDTGLGIPADQQARIFEPFYRAPARRFSQGMGLGLSIARDLVNAHGGRLEVKSAPGCGSCFTLWLPITT